MHWFVRPPYVRWLAATLLVIGAAYLDLRGPRLEAHPFAASRIPAGASLAESDIVWRDVPVGLFGDIDLAGVAARMIEAGEPVVASATDAGGPVVPAGWWQVPLSIAGEPSPGTPVRVVVLDPPLEVDGLVASIGTMDPFAAAPKVLVAVPPDVAARVARAATANLVVVLIGSG